MDRLRYRMTGVRAPKVWSWVFPCLLVLWPHVPRPRAESVLSLTLGASEGLVENVDMADLEPLRAYLEASGVRLEGMALPSSAVLTRRLIDGTIDVGVFSPVDYVRAHARYPALVPFVTHVVNGMRYMQGYVVVRADSRIHRIEELRGRRFAYTAPGAFGGHLFPRYLLVKHGWNPATFFSSTIMTRDYLESLWLVYRGDVDGAGVIDEVLRLSEAADMPRRAFRVLAKSPRVPYIAYVARPGLPPETLDRLQRVLKGKRFKRLYLRATGARWRRPQVWARIAPRREVTWAVNGFIACKDADFDRVRRMLRVLEQPSQAAGPGG